MTSVISLLAQFKAQGVEEVKSAFRSIGSEAEKAAAVTKRQQQVAAQNLRDYARTQVLTEKERAREVARAQTAQRVEFQKNAIALSAMSAAAVKFSVDSYKSYQAYARQVRDLAQVSGTGATEASKLLQVLDDYEISAEQVTAATRFMTKQGLVPTIETLAKLSDQYRAIQDPMKQNEFILKNLGRSGLQWVNVLNQGGDALMSMSEDVNKNLILNDMQIQKAEQQRLAVDALSDAWQGVKMSFGAWVGGAIPGFTSIMDALFGGKKFQNFKWDTNAGQFTYDVVNQLQRPDQIISDYIRTQQAQSGGLPPSIDAARAAVGQIQMQSYRAGEKFIPQGFTPSGGPAATPINYEMMLSAGTQLTDMTEKTRDATRQLNEQLAIENAEMAKLAEQGYDVTNKKMEEHAANAQKIRAEITKVAEAEKKATNDIMQANIAAAATDENRSQKQLDYALASGQITKEAYAQERALQAIADAYAGGKMSADQAFMATQRVIAGLKALNGMKVDAFINLIINGTMPSFMGGGGIGTSAPTGGASNKNKDKTIYSDAAGGQWVPGTWTLVGDKPGGGLTPHSELISPTGYIHSNRETMQLIASGVVNLDNVRSAAQGGVDLYTNAASGSIKRSARTPTGASGPGRQNPTPGYSAELVGNMSAFSDAIVPEIASQLAGITMSETSRMTNAIGNMKVETQRTNDLLASILDKVASDRGISSAVSSELAKLS